MEQANLCSTGSDNELFVMEFIKADIERYFGNQRRSLNLSMLKKGIIFSELYGLHAILVYRFGNLIEYKITGRKVFLIKQLLLCAYKILNYLVIKMYDIRISHKAIIGKGFYIGHFSNIVIAKCIIGENCSLHQGVHIEEDVSDSMKQQSNIGNNVWIGAHVKIKKGINIGDGASVAPGSVVDKDIEEKCLAMGNPIRIIKRNYNNSKLLCLDT